MTTPRLAPPLPNTSDRVTQMIRADIDVRAFYRWAGSRGMIGRNAFDPGFAMHCLLTESFGAMAPKPFRIMIPRDRAANTGSYTGTQASMPRNFGQHQPPMQIRCSLR